MTKVEELLQEINDTLEDIANSLQPSRGRDFIGLDGTLAALIVAVREDERNRIETEGFLLRDANSVLQIGKCSVIPTAELNAIAEYCNIPEPKEADKCSSD